MPCVHLPLIGWHFGQAGFGMTKIKFDTSSHAQHVGDGAKWRRVDPLCERAADAGRQPNAAALGQLGLIENSAWRCATPSSWERPSSPEAVQGEENWMRAGAWCCRFVDPHTHVIWAGDRAREFGMRLEGAKYLDILAAGGGILSTVRSTRAASKEDLIRQTRPRLMRMLMHGTTTVEAKTGYGLETEAELKPLPHLEVAAGKTFGNG
jgi:hypothetical protein